MQLLDNFDPITGDDTGYSAPRLSQLPEGFGFANLQQHNDCPLTNARWDKLVDFATRYYRHFEIVGYTYADFQDNLQLAYDVGADTLERQLEVYNDDIAKPILGRTEETVYDLHDSDSENTSEDETIDSTGTVTNESDSQTDNIDVPVDASDPNTQIPSAVTKSNGNDSSNQTSNNTRNRKYDSTKGHDQTGSVKVTLSDLGVRPNYESLNGFIDNNRTDLAVFVWLFRDCFAFNEVLVW